MAGEIPDLNALVRTGTGKGAARQARRDGLVPGIVYGGGNDPLAINIPYNVLFKKLKDGRFLSTLYNMKVEGEDDVRVICRNVQRDVVKDLPTHVDFMRLKRTTKINLFIPVEVLGEDDCPGIRQGGLLTMVRPEVELIVTAGDIPESITISVEGLEIGDTITISDVDLPAGAKTTIDRDFVIANISAPSALASAADDEEEAEEGVEGEDVAEGEEAEGGEESGEE
ncbi:MAG: 50S ribosomal protein L25/general stress protein Ctc [Silicimonas sp.]|nr:50S ribosomal protein L25/general stress protein Ctc [Silicimonas sp.]